MNNKIELRKISSLSEETFYIPSYQRGYRWTEQQVKDLLNDIWEYALKPDSKFYCIQPLVICKKDDNTSYNVIDGQQRLTTIFLILNELSKKIFSLIYSRESYLERVNKIAFDNSCKFALFWKKLIAEQKEYDKIEFFYLLKARFVIKDWFQNKNACDKKQFTDVLLDSVSFIWYPITDRTKEHEYFRNLNSGKIPLTNSELIKALFLESESFGGDSFAQSLCADEFDQMERVLRNDDFWYFLAGNDEKNVSCLDLLFTLLRDTSCTSNEYCDLDFGVFFFFKDEISSKPHKELWERIRNTFYILEGWYQNPVTYNLIGYLRACCGNNQKYSLSNLFKLYEQSPTKAEFVLQLKEYCKDSINYKNDSFLKLQYKDNKIRNLLLFLNIATLLQNPSTKIKFQFADFHKYNWDVEHISPKQPKTDDIITTIKEFYEKENEKIEDKEKKKKPCKELLTLMNKGKSEKIIEQYFASDEILNTLANHTLLSDHTNRGIGNGFFFEKRKKLIEYYQQGYYIPPCSMNVFQKFYSDSPDNMLFWSEEDQEDYLKKIKKIIHDFFEEQ